MSFLHPQLLWLLWIPFALLLAALPRRRSANARPPHPRIARAELAHDTVALRAAALSRRPRVWYLAIGLAFAVLALARPQGRTIAEPAFVESRDVLVAVDVSRSMLAEDVAPNRLARAQLLIRTLADALKGERLGLLPFAGTAFLQSPLSADYEIFRTFLDQLGPDMIPLGGSDFAALLRAADEAFGLDETNANAADDAEPPADRYLVVLSDGEAQDDTWKALADKLAKRGVRVLALGLGTEAGALIPDGKGSFVKDEKGGVVLSRLNADTLRQLARMTDGAYRDASAWVDLPALLRDTVARGRGKREVVESSPRREELFAWALAPALGFLFLSLWREFPVVPRPRRLPLATKTAAALLAIGIVSPWSTPTRAAEEDTAPADPLVELVGRLAAAPTLRAADLAHLASLTAERAEQTRGQNDALPKDALRDGLAAVAQGRALDPKAADWDGLQRKLDALLAPPPKPESQPEQPKDKQPPSEQSESSDSSQSGQSDAGQQNKPPEKPESSNESQDGESQPKSASDSSDSGSPQSDQSQNGGSPAEPKTGDQPRPNSPALGDLSDNSKPDQQQADAAQPSPGETPENDQHQPPGSDSAEETQLAGGVSASGQNADSAASFNPALAVPLQRLDRVRDADAPARLFQLMQDAESPPDAEARAAAGAKRDW